MGKNNETIVMFIWTVTLAAMLGSLFFSEVMGYTPCELCWIQRILMYPLVVIYGVALLKKDFAVALPGVIMSGIGIVVSAYHYLLQKVPALQETGDACGVVPCNTQYTNYFGFITIPLLALVAFSVIFVLHIVVIKQLGRN